MVLSEHLDVTSVCCVSGRARALPTGQREQCSCSSGRPEREGDGAERAEVSEGCRAGSDLQGGPRGPAAVPAGGNQRHLCSLQRSHPQTREDVHRGGRLTIDCT